MISPARGAVGGRGERDARHAGKALAQHGELQVLGPEVVAPLRDAMRLVDGEQRQRHCIEQRQAALGQQPLGRDVEQVELARRAPAAHVADRLRPAQARS